MKKILTLLLVVFLSSSAAIAGELTEAQILAEAENRIAQYRTGRAALRLAGPEGKLLPPGLTLNIEQTRHQFLFGCNIFRLGRCRTTQNNADYEKYYADLFNFATLPFYWWNYARVKDRPDDARTDEILRFCREHRLTAKGHPLAWNFRDPRWLPDNPDEALRLQFERIDRCVRRFKGGIDIWDVVNEATHYEREQVRRQAPKLTGAIDRIGVPAYLHRAFAAARRANPDAVLIINDYRTDPAYAEKVIKKLIDNQGRPLYDVIGIQSHQHGGYWGAKKTWEVCQRHARFGKPLHYTETTFVSGSKTKEGWNTTPDGEKTQARHAVEFYTVLFSHPAVEAITWWDFTDQGAWQGAPAGFLRKDMTPKPLYHDLKNLVKGKWWTKTRTEIQRQGAAAFRGFYGDYRVSVTHNGHTLSADFHFDKNTPLPLKLTLK